jgi:hypothetical protein
VRLQWLRRTYFIHIHPSKFTGAFVPKFIRLAAIAAVAGLFSLTGCDSGDGSSPEGTSTVQGNVASYSIDGVAYVPGEETAVGGVGVHMMGTDLSTTTDDNGYFIMSGVPAGLHQMQFMFNGQISTIDVNVPDDGIVTMQDIRCYGQQPATVGHMNVQMNTYMGSGNNMHGGGK